MNVGRTSLLLVPLALAARGVAFFVPVVFAAWYGVSNVMDAFFYALNIPTFFLVLGASAVATVIVPPLAALAERDPAGRSLFVGAALTWSVLVTVALGVAIGLVLPLFLPYTDFDAPTRDLTWGFYWRLLPVVSLNAATAVLKSACDVSGRFRLAAASPVLRTVVLIGTAGLMRDQGPASLPLAIALGLLAECVWLGGVLLAEGIVPWPTLRVPPALAATARMLIPVLTGETLLALNVVIDKQFAAGLPSGAVSILEYADRARLIPQTLLETTLLVVAYSAWARARARGDEAGRHRAVATTFWWIGMLAPPMLGGMTVGREALVRLLFEHGAFDPTYTALCADVLGAFLVGLLAALVAVVAFKAHVVAGRYRLVGALGILSFALNTTLNAVFIGPFGLVGLAWSTTLTTAIVALAAFAPLWPELRHRLAPETGRQLLGAVGASALLTATLTATIRPARVDDPALWLCAVPYLMVLAWSGRKVALQGASR